jgi:hypothetical protein
MLGVQVHEPSAFAQDVEDDFWPNWPPGLTDVLYCAEGAMLTLASAEGLTGTGATELAGALTLGAGAGALDLGGAGAFTVEEEGDEGAVLNGAGAGAWLDGAGTTVAAGVELGLGFTIVVGSGFDSLSILAGMMFFMIIKRD